MPEKNMKRQIIIEDWEEESFAPAVDHRLPEAEADTTVGGRSRQYKRCTLNKLISALAPLLCTICLEISAQAAPDQGRFKAASSEQSRMMAVSTGVDDLPENA